METLKILFLGGGKRVSMARKFVSAGCKRGLDVSIYGYEGDTRVPLAAVGTVIAGKRFSDPDVCADIYRLAQSTGISIVVPFVDSAVAVAAECMRQYPGQLFAPTCNAAMAERMFDKVSANRAFMSRGLPVPRPWNGFVFDRPMIAKPRHGSASKGIINIDSARDLEKINSTRYLVQERIDHRREYTVDCYISLVSGQICAVVPRVRDEVSGGEVVRTTVLHDANIDTLVRRTLSDLDLKGAVTVQVIEDIDTGRLMLMEINPRLGGGAVAAVHAGADIPGMIIDDAAGRAPQAADLYHDVLVTRFLDEVSFEL